MFKISRKKGVVALAPGQLLQATLEQTTTSTNYSSFSPLLLFLSERGVIRRGWDRREKYDYHDKIIILMIISLVIK